MVNSDIDRSLRRFSIDFYGVQAQAARQVGIAQFWRVVGAWCAALVKRSGDDYWGDGMGNGNESEHKCAKKRSEPKSESPPKGAINHRAPAS